ncbi:glycosyltransferase family 4 protein [Prosthecobacter sp.]|uniref:glycosyltransferase family 4 protein n=1 Tax=Prosthecobacter sp. TaxID=1965333 RepID=UPI003784EBC9
MIPTSPDPSSPSSKAKPVFGFILVGGAVVGAQVRDVRLANELVRRGYEVHAWWAFDRPNNAVLDRRITQHWLFSWSRYAGLGWYGVEDAVGRLSHRLFPAKFRDWVAQTCPGFMERQMTSVLRHVCRGVERDRGLITSFARELEQTGVTHLLPNLEMLALFAKEARDLASGKPRYVVTFQGYEIYANFARPIGLEARLYQKLAEAVAHSGWPAVAVSDAYSERIQREIGLKPSQVASIPPGVPVGEPLPLDRARELVARQFPSYNPALPLVTYLGRRDAEKGLDLLLYAVRLLEERGISVQLALCGPTAFGKNYVHACGQIAEHLRIKPLLSDYVSDEIRSALFRVSRTVVYPSIHQEPFGMVPVEAMAQGTPVIVPNLGGISKLIEAGGHRGGLTFACWDTGSLATKLENLVTDNTLHEELARGSRKVAEHFSIENMGTRVLAHLGLGPL